MDAEQIEIPPSPFSSKEIEMEEVTQSEEDVPPSMWYGCMNRMKEETLSVFGVPIPPSKVEAEFGDASVIYRMNSAERIEYQRKTWLRLGQVITELVIKANTTNLKTIVANLFAENIIRGKGFFTTACINQQRKHPRKTRTYAVLTLLVNSKFPAVVDLLFKRLCFHIGHYKDDYNVNLLVSLKYIPHLFNLEVILPTPAVFYLDYFLKTRTNESVKLAVQFFKELQLPSRYPPLFQGVKRQFLAIVKEKKLDKDVIGMVIEVLNKWESTFLGNYSLSNLNWVKNQLRQVLLPPVHYDVRKPILGQELLQDEFKPEKLFLEHEIAFHYFRREVLLKGHWMTCPYLLSRKGRERKIVCHKFSDSPESNSEKILAQIKPGEEMFFCVEFLSEALLGFDGPYRLLFQYICGKNKQYRELLNKSLLVMWLMIPGINGTYSNCESADAAEFCVDLLTFNAVSLDSLVYMWSQPRDMTLAHYEFLKCLFRGLASKWTERVLLEKLEESPELLQVLYPEDDPYSAEFTLRFFKNIRLHKVEKFLVKMRSFPFAD